MKNNASTTAIPQNRYAVELMEFTLTEVNILKTEKLIDDAVYEQRLDQGFRRDFLDQAKNQIYERDELEEDGITAKLPTKLPRYKLFHDDFKCTAKNAQPRPNRDPLFLRQERLRTPWHKEIGIFWDKYRNETEGEGDQL